MDWIETAVDGINTDTLSGDNSSEASIKMITFLSCADILWEGIQQLHRVLIDRRTIPFASEKNLFKEKLPVYDSESGMTVQTDNVYFKTIRAIFAAHPVNLTDHFGDQPGDKNERWFASWSGGTFSKASFGVFLYCNKPGVEARPFDIYFSELFAFAKQRYDYLEALSHAAEKHIENYKKQWCETAIIVDQSDTIGWIHKLLEENEKRGDTDFIRYELEKALYAFTVVPACEKNKAVLEEYREAIKIQLQQIQDGLQSMTFDAIGDVKGNLPFELQYAAEKLFTDDSVLWGWGAERIQEYLGDIVDLSQQAGIIDTQMIARAGIWYKDHNGL